MKKIERDAILLGRFEILKMYNFLFLIVVEKSPNNSLELCNTFKIRS